MGPRGTMILWVRCTHRMFFDVHRRLLSSMTPIIPFRLTTESPQSDTNFEMIRAPFHHLTQWSNHKTKINNQPDLRMTNTAMTLLLPPIEATPLHTRHRALRRGANNVNHSLVHHCVVCPAVSLRGNGDASLPGGIDGGDAVAAIVIKRRR